MKWITNKLGDLCKIYQPQTITSEEILKEGPYKVFGANGVIGYYDKYNHENSEVLVTCRGATCGTINISEPKSWITGNAMVVAPNAKNLSKMFLYYTLINTNLLRTISGAAQPQITRSSLSPFKISLPPLEIQQKIVDRLDEIRKAQELHEKQIGLSDELFQSLLSKELNPEGKNWKLKSLGEIAIFKRGPFGGSLKKEIFVESGYKVYEQKNVIYNNFKLGNYFINKDKYSEMISFSIKPGDLIISCSGTIGKVAIVPDNFKPGIINQALLKITPNNSILLSKYLKLLIQSKSIQVKLFFKIRGSAIRNVASVREIKRIKISLPPLKIQHKIVEKISSVQEYKKRLLEQKSKLQELFESVLNKSMKGEM